MTDPDPTLARIGRGIGLTNHGEHDAARALFAEIWRDIGGADGDPLYCCATAHAMADVQDDVQLELTWDLLALQAADRIADSRLAGAGIAAGAAGFFPSLHLNLAECYRRIGDVDRARVHLRCARAAIAALPDDGSQQLVSTGLDRLASRLPAL